MSESRGRWPLVAAALISIFVVGVGIFNAVSPQRAGQRPMIINAGIVTSVWGSAAQAGVRVGDRYYPPQLHNLNFSQRLKMSPFPRAGDVQVRIFERAGHRFKVRYTLGPYPDFPGGRIIDLAVELACVLLGCLVLARGKRGDLATALCGYTITLAATAAFADVSLTAPTAAVAYAFTSVLQGIATIAQYYFLFRLIGLFPDGFSPVQRLAFRIAPIAASIGLVLIVQTSLSLFTDDLTARSIINNTSNAWAGCVNLLGFVVVLWSLAHVAPEHRARMRWFASTLLVFQFLACFVQVTISPYWPSQPVLLGVLLNYVTNLGPLGPIYATLRHRLIDLDMVVSRSAIYGALSVAIVGAFIGAEWLAGRIADAFIGEAARGLATQIVSFAIAIAVGLSARYVHGAIERRVNDIFFRARMRRLESLKRFAYEADITDSRDTLLRLTYQTLTESLDAPAVALYIAQAGGFVAAHAADAAPRRLDKDDRLILRLLRWSESFRNESETLHDWLIVPLLIRTTVVGFIASAPKTDHTAYLPDEIAALQSVADHVATSLAFIESGGVSRLPSVQPAYASR